MTLQGVRNKRKFDPEYSLDNKVLEYGKEVVDKAANNAHLPLKEFLQKANIRYAQQEKKRGKSQKSSYGKYYLPACVSVCSYGECQKKGESGTPEGIRRNVKLKSEMEKIGGIGHHAKNSKCSNIIGQCAEQRDRLAVFVKLGKGIAKEPSGGAALDKDY